MSPRDVVVTGVGAVTAVGVGIAALADALEGARSGLRPLRVLDCLYGGEAPTPARSRMARHLDRSASLFLVAAEEAWRDAGLAQTLAEPMRGAVIEGSSLGPLSDVLDTHRQRIVSGDTSPPRPTGLVRFMTGAGGAAFAQQHAVHGPVLHVSAGSVSATTAIGEAYAKVALGQVDIAVAGGAECPLQEVICANFRAAGLLAEQADGPSCRPFDISRAGTVLGEGAGILILESAEHAARRGARVHARIGGYGLANEAFSMIAPDPAGAGVAAAAQQALDGVDRDVIGWIKTHGTGTRANDAAECHGLAAVFGDRLGATPLTALKPTFGHCLGASGAVEAVAAIVALERRFIPATLGTTVVDPALPRCDVALEVRESRARGALLLAESFGGRCAALTLLAA